MCFEFQVGDLKNIWLIDSDSSRHMTGDKGWFTSLVPVVTKRRRSMNIEGPIRRTREGGEWEPIKILLEGDGNSNKMNTASNTCLRLTTQVGQAHVATGVPLDLGTNTQPSDPRTQRNTKPRVH
jgi:hypothetical protein